MKPVQSFQPPCFPGSIPMVLKLHLNETTDRADRATYSIFSPTPSDGWERASQSWWRPNVDQYYDFQWKYWCICWFCYNSNGISYYFINKIPKSFETHTQFACFFSGRLPRQLPLSTEITTGNRFGTEILKKLQFRVTIQSPPRPLILLDWIQFSNPHIPDLD